MLANHGAAMKLPSPGHVDHAVQRGLSLVELLIAVALGLVVTATVAQIFIGSKQSYRVTDSLSRTQENARFALDQISRDIRMAGFKGSCLDAKNAVFTNRVNKGTDDYFDFSKSIQGYEAGSSSWTPALATLISGATPAPQAGSDILTVRSSTGSAYAVTTTMAGTSADINIPSGNKLKKGQFAMICDASAAAIFQISNDTPSTGTLSHDIGIAVSPGNSLLDLGHAFTLGSDLSIVETYTYYIAPSASGSGTSLWRLVGSSAPAEVIDGIQGMQITYGIDTDGDSNANKFVAASSITATDWGQVVSVRVSLLLRSVEDGLTTAYQPYTFDGTTTTPTDHRQRRVFTTTVSLRNHLS
jgi:type IV pilus assembly protein PilW